MAKAKSSGGAQSTKDTGFRKGSKKGVPASTMMVGTSMRSRLGKMMQGVSEGTSNVALPSMPGSKYPVINRIYDAALPWRGWTAKSRVNKAVGGSTTN